MTEQRQTAKDVSSRLRIQPARAWDERPVSISARLGRLQFHNSGKFRVLVFADVQDGPKLNVDTVRLMEASIDATRPDVVIFSGNQIAGYDEAYAPTFRKRTWTAQSWPMRPETAKKQAEEHEKLHDTVRGFVAKLVEPLVLRGIPWAVTYGNHDFQSGLSNVEQDAIYREFPGCLNPESEVLQTSQSNGHGSGRGASAKTGFDHPRRQPGSGLPDQPIYSCEPGTFALPVSDSGHTRNVLGLVLLNSGDYSKLGGYGVPTSRALRFLDEMPRVLGVKSMVFQHIPLPQYYDLLKEVPANAAHAVEGYRTFAGHTYAIDEEKTVPGSFLGEGISCPDGDSGEFEVLSGSQGYFGVLAGHDHRNRFTGTSEGLTMMATPTCGFGSYGPAPAQRAARLLEFDIRHPYEPRTQLIEFGEVVGKPKSHGAYTYDLNGARDANREGTNLLRKPRFVARLLRGLHLRK